MNLDLVNEKLEKNEKLNKEEVEYLIHNNMINKTIIEYFDSDLEFEVIIEVNHKNYMLYYTSNVVHEIDTFESQIAIPVIKQKKEIEVWDTIPKKYYIAEFSKDYADEFDYYRTFLLTEEELNNINKIIKEHENRNEEQEFYFGTNEGWTTTVLDIYTDISYREIPKETYYQLQSLLECGLPNFLDLGEDEE